MRKENTGTRIKRFFAMLAIIAVLMLIAVVAVTTSKLSDDALALGSGVAMGCVGALIPVALLAGVLRYVLRYLDERELRRSQRYGHPANYAQPPVIVVPGGYPQQFPPAWAQGNDAHFLPSTREFTIIGEE